MLARFLLTRGAWLILLDIVVVSPIWALELGRIHLATLWAIGFSMSALAGLVWLPPRAVLLAGALLLTQPQFARYSARGGVRGWGTPLEHPS